jgi:hypothetical protein
VIVRLGFRAHPAEVRVRDGCSRLAEEDADLWAPVGRGDPEIIGELAEQVVGIRFERHFGCAEHALGLRVVGCQRCFPVPQPAPLLGLEERSRRYVERVCVHQASGPDAAARKDRDVLEPFSVRRNADTLPPNPDPTTTQS